jgi:hypothetical protein
LVVSIATLPAFAAVDAWDTSQKNLITSCEDWNRWLDQLVPALTQYRDSLVPEAGRGQQIQNQITAVNRFLGEAEGFKCTQDAQLTDKKLAADLLLNPINLVRKLSKLWVAGTQLYGLTIEFILKSLAGDAEIIPFKLINAVLDFLIEGASAAGNKDAEKKLREVKKLKEAVEKGKDTLDKLRQAVEALSRT